MLPKNILLWEDKVNKTDKIEIDRDQLFEMLNFALTVGINYSLYRTSDTVAGQRRWIEFLREDTRKQKWAMGDKTGLRFVKTAIKEIKEKYDIDHYEDLEKFIDMVYEEPERN